MNESPDPAPAEPGPSGAAPEAAGALTDSTGPAGSDGSTADPRELARTSRHAVWGWRSNLDQIMPVVLFLVFFNIDALQVAGLNNIEVAIIAATAWSVKAAYSRRRRGLPIGAWLPVITGYLLVRAAISIAVERDLIDFGVSTEAAYFGIGIGTKMLVGLAAAATVIAGKPFALWAARRFLRLPDEVHENPTFVSTMRNVTWVITVYEVGSAVWDIWLYNSAGVNLFLVARQVVNFFAAFLLIFATLVYVDRRLSKTEGCPSLADLVSRATRRAPASDT